MAGNLNDVTAMIINWQTLDLTTQCVRGLQHCYPALKIIVVDNGSKDQRNSTATIASWGWKKPNVSAILNKSNYYDHDLPMPAVGLRECKYGVRRVFDIEGNIHKPFLIHRVLRVLFTGGNIGHGPALHQVLMLCKTPYLLSIDSDCIVQRCGFIEDMLAFFNDSNVYAVGREVRLDRRGTAQPMRKWHRGLQHIHGSVMLLDVVKYRTLEPFVHFGAISVHNMPDATAKGYKLQNYDIGGKRTAVHHLFYGSRKRYAKFPNLRSSPFMPNVFLDGLHSEFIGGYF